MLLSLKIRTLLPQSLIITFIIAWFLWHRPKDIDKGSGLSCHTCIIVYGVLISAVIMKIVLRYYCDILYEWYVSEGRYNFQIHITHTGYHITVSLLNLRWMICAIFHTYLANYSLSPVIHAELCLSLFILYGESRVICTPTILKLTWPLIKRIA